MGLWLVMVKVMASISLSLERTVALFCIMVKIVNRVSSRLRVWLWLTLGLGYTVARLGVVLELRLSLW